MEKKTLKNLCNVKMHWISMLSLAKRILVKYKSLVMHMFNEHALNTKAKGNLNLLCDVETFLGLSYIIPLLGCM
jgi:hypothetical protein